MDYLLLITIMLLLYILYLNLDATNKIDIYFMQAQNLCVRNMIAKRDPTNNDVYDHKCPTGSTWINDTTGDAFILIFNKWKKIKIEE